MATTTIQTKEHLAIVKALQAKYLGDGSNPPQNGSNTPQYPNGTVDYTPPTYSPILNSTSQEVSNMAVHPPGGTRTRRKVKNSILATSSSSQTPCESSVMNSVTGIITAILKPSCMDNPPDEIAIIDTIEAQVVDNIPSNTHTINPSNILKPTYQDLVKQDKRRGRWLAVVMRIEFDPSCLSLSYVQKAEMVGLRDLCGNDDEDLVFQYTSILNDVEFVANRKKALEAFESEMDIPTAVSIAQAAKRDPQFAIFRRRLRQMDEKRRVGGDQREQFGQLMAFLRGDTDEVDLPTVTSSNNNGSNDNDSQQDSGTTGEDDEGEAEPE